MSLGFLTESALLPSKAKKIKVDSKSILDLKAVVFQKEQERKERHRRLHEETGDGGANGLGATRRKRADHRDGENGGRNRDRYGDAVGKSVYARLQSQKRRRGAREKESNRGVDERRRRDDQDRELDVDNSDDDAALQKKSREMLARKAKLYDQMMQGKQGAVSVAAAKECLVDFDGKRKAGDLQAMVADGVYERATDTVEITDEFGRSRVVEKGSSDHVEYVQRETTAKSESLFFEDKHRHEGRDEEEERAIRGGGSFVVSQWEKTLKSDEKQYLEQVHAGVERVKQSNPSALTDKQRRKQLRLEKLKQQQQHVQGQPPAVSASVDAHVQNPQQATDAAVQAAAFLNQFSTSFM